MRVIQGVTFDAVRGVFVIAETVSMRSDDGWQQENANTVEVSQDDVSPDMLDAGRRLMSAALGFRLGQVSKIVEATRVQAAVDGVGDV